MYGADSLPLRPSTPDQLAATRTPTRSAPSSSESPSSQSLVRQASAPVTSLQKSLTKLYSLTTTATSSGGTGPVDRSPARSPVEPIIEKDGEAEEVHQSPMGGSWLVGCPHWNWDSVFPLNALEYVLKFLPSKPSAICPPLTLRHPPAKFLSLFFYFCSPTLALV